MFRRVLWLSLVASVTASLAWAETTTRISVGSNGVQGSSGCYSPFISANGRYVSFVSGAFDLVTGYHGQNVFTHDRVTGAITCDSVASDGQQADGGSCGPSLSADGRYVAFVSRAPNLVDGDTNGFADVFVRDRLTGDTVLSVITEWTRGNGGSSYGTISADGRYVTFQSDASNLVPEYDTNYCSDIFVGGLSGGIITMVSHSNQTGVTALAGSYCPSISADGRYVAFVSSAPNLVDGDTNGFADVFVRDRQTGTTTRVSVASDGTQANYDINYGYPAISADGRYVAFNSLATNLVPGDTNGCADTFVHDRATGVTTRVSVAADGTQANGPSGSYGGERATAISSDGRYVAFTSVASNLVAGDTNGTCDVFVRDRISGTTSRVSVSSSGEQGNNDSGSPSISADGRYVAFVSCAWNLVVGDTNRVDDVFVHDRGAPAPPTAPTSVTISPSSPGPEDLTATATGSTDADGDSLTYKYQWSKKIGATWSAWGYTGRTLAASNVKVGDIWRVRAQALDGTSGSPWKVGSGVKIVNMAGVTPAPKTYNVPVTTCVFASFRWPVKQATVTSRVQLKLNTKVIPTVMTWVTAEKKIKLRPKSPLLPNTYYRVNIDPGIECTSGRVLGWGENYWFKTAPATTTAAVTIAAAPTAGGAEFTINLTSAATVRTVISNIAGRVIAELAERDLPAGVSSLLWNGRSNSGSNVPAGTYLVRVVAIGNEGTQTTAIAPLQIR